MLFVNLSDESSSMSKQPHKQQKNKVEKTSGLATPFTSHPEPRHRYLCTFLINSSISGEPPW